MMWHGFVMGIRSLGAHRLRAALTALGIIIGVASVVTVVAVAEGARKQISDRIASLGANILLVMPGAQNAKGVRSAAGTQRSLTRADSEAIKFEIPNVVTTAAFVTGKHQLIAGNANWNTRVAGVTVEYLSIREWAILDGLPFTADQEARAEKVVVIGTTVAKELFGHVSVVGRSLRIKNVPFTVIGVLKPKGQNLSGGDQDDVAMIPLATAKRRTMGRSRVNPDAVHFIVAKVFQSSAVSGAANDIAQVLRQRHRLTARQPNDFQVHNMLQVTETREAAYRQFTVLVSLLATVSLVVGGIGVMNIMLVSVTERTREIGIRLAIGARRRDIRYQFLIEASTICSLGGLAGLAAGYGAAKFLTGIVGWPTLLRWDLVLLALICSTAVGLVFGYFPAARAARLDPAAAVRFE